MISVLEISFRTVIWFVIKPSRVRNITRLTVNQVISVTGWYFSPLLGSIREFGLSFFCLIQQQPKHKKSIEESLARAICGNRILRYIVSPIYKLNGAWGRFNIEIMNRYSDMNQYDLEMIYCCKRWDKFGF